MSDASQGGAWNTDDLAKQHLIDSLLNNDVFSLPFRNGKPIKIKDLLKSKPDSPHPGQRKRNSGMIGTGRNSDLSIQDRKFKATVFASRFKPNVEANTVKRELEADLLRITGTPHNVSVEKVTSRYDHYASFKITCFCDNTAVFMNNSLWPPGVYFRWWIKA